MGAKKIFTYEEAKVLIPTVRRITQTAFEQADHVAQQLQTPNLEDDQRSELEGEYETIVTGWAEQIFNLGCEIKGLWLVDFDNGKGYYCWKYPEQGLSFFHSYEEGFGGRMRIN
ncbi:MAG: DUF2203 family protein [Acidobacteriia bacterium]|nr:DUF2203 family protein [Terriglobia bacterium]